MRIGKFYYHVIANPIVDNDVGLEGQMYHCLKAVEMYLSMALYSYRDSG